MWKIPNFFFFFEPLPYEFWYKKRTQISSIFKLENWLSLVGSKYEVLAVGTTMMFHIFSLWGRVSSVWRERIFSISLPQLNSASVGLHNQYVNKGQRSSKSQLKIWPCVTNVPIDSTIYNVHTILLYYYQTTQTPSRLPLPSSSGPNLAWLLLLWRFSFMTFLPIVERVFLGESVWNIIFIRQGRHSHH